MTSAQKLSVAEILRAIDDAPRWDDICFAHHGDCVGADADLHDLCVARGWVTIGHLPVDATHRAFCAFTETRSPSTHMARNRAIVAESDVMIACPAEPEEQPRGGTWATVRMTRKAGKPLALVLPDGTVRYERWPDAH
jgi:hypothetical protein